jgi:signal transduction histidine kinase
VTGRSVIAPLLCLVAFACRLSAQTAGNWRFWTVADGLRESYVRTLIRAQDGQVWVRHGAVDMMSVVDGYGVRRLPEPRTTRAVDWEHLGRVQALHGDEAWVAEDHALRRYAAGAWKIAERERPGDAMLAAAPAREGVVLVLFRDRIAVYEAKARSWTVIRSARNGSIGAFTDLQPGFAQDFWITAAHGFARLVLGPQAEFLGWKECDTGPYGLRDLDRALPSGHNEVFVMGRRGSLRAAARWQQSGLEIVLTSKHQNLRSWRGPEGSVWGMEGVSLFRLVKGKKVPVSKLGVLSGVLFDVATEPDGGFWLATSDGLAHYTASLWRTPETISGLDLPVHAIAEDRTGRLWFAATEYLLELNGSRWRRHALPAGARTDTVYTNSINPLPDGRLMLKARDQQERHDLVFIFDPASGRFQPLVHPQGRQIGLLAQRPDGTFWARMVPGCRLEIFDGRRFQPRLDISEQWKGDDVRSILEASSGALWIGGAAGAGVWQQGTFRMLGPAEGFTESAGFMFVELRPGHILAGGRNDLLRFDGVRWSVWRSGLERVRSVLETRDGVLWVASGSGVHRWQDGEWITNGEPEGLPSSTAYKIFQDSRGRIWAGTSRGLAIYYPATDAGQPRTLLSEAGNARQAPPDGNMRILFSAIDKWKTTAADRLLFSHRLDDGAWTQFMSATSASFSHLAPGRHAVQVRAMDRNGNRETKPDAFEFTVVLPWYRQAGFLALAFAGTMLMAILVASVISNYRQRGALIAQLTDARMAAEAASRHKSEFLANMSHEIRTPMNAILGMTQLSLETSLNDEQKEYLQSVQTAADSLLVLLNDVLDFSKIEAGKLAIVPVDFNLQDCVNDVLRTLALRARQSGLELSPRFDRRAPPSCSATASGCARCC